MQAPPLAEQRQRLGNRQKTCGGQGQRPEHLAFQNPWPLATETLPPSPLPHRPTFNTPVHCRTSVGAQADLTQCTLSWPRELAQTEAPDTPCASTGDPGLVQACRGAPGSPGWGLERRGRRTKPPLRYPPSPWGGGPGSAQPCPHPHLPWQGQPRPTPTTQAAGFSAKPALHWGRGAATPRATPHRGRWGGSLDPHCAPFLTRTPIGMCQLQPPPARTGPA